MTLNRFLLTIASLTMVAGAGSCERKPEAILSPFEFHNGFMTMKWGSSRQSLDSLIRGSRLQIVADLDEAPGQSITVVRDSSTDYYLEWSSEDRLDGLSTIHEHADHDEADSLIARLTRAYGDPVLTAKQAAYVQQRWQAKGLSVEVITTDRYYSLKVHHP